MEDQQPSEAGAPSLVNHALKHGIILGAISIVIIVLCYVVDISIMVSFKFIGLMLVVGLGYVIYAGINFRSEGDGFLSYGKAYQHGFMVLAISGVVGTIFGIILYHVVDPDLSSRMTEAIIKNTEEMMAGFGAPQESIDKAIEGMRSDMPNQFTIGGQALGFLKSLIWYAIIAAITSLFVRRNQPEAV